MAVLTPKVNETQEFIEIAFDFSNPLDLVREAISNSFDAKAKEIKIAFSVEDEDGEKRLKIELEDNGEGMNMEGLQSFFDLGNSSRKNKEKNSTLIGEKGHGTKVYLNCSKLIVETEKDGKRLVAEMNQPKKNLYSKKIPEVNVSESICDESNHGTKITIYGYNNNRRDKFIHEIVKDYILWFTKMGSIEKVFGKKDNKDVLLFLKGIDREDFETIKFGHIFPEKESLSISDLFDRYSVEAPKWYCKKIIKQNCSLKNSPEIKFDAVFYIEGSKVKYSYNKMIKHPGYSAPEGAYTVQERYGLWLCKDYLPIQRKNEWIVKKGSEYTRFHAFVNCQELKLTANRGSIENTPTEIMQDLYNCVKEIYESILESSDWSDIDYLESQVEAVSTVNREKRDFEKRIEYINKSKIADYKGIRLTTPLQEQGVFCLYMQLSQVEKDLFPFEIIDYDTHTGIDVIVKDKGNIPTKNAKLYYVEFKNRLENVFNHSFENTHSIICWDVNVKHNEEVIDVAQKARILKIVPGENEDDYTHFYLDDIRSNRKIEVFVLCTFLAEKLHIRFRSRTENEVYKEN